MVAIKDMEMPKCCLWDCPLAREDGGACQLVDIRTSNKERPSDCPLIEIGTCKDCRWLTTDEDGNYYCRQTWDFDSLDFYCADFEKRGSENEAD
jgi:hypothetical protein